jgi:hypothetical protein
MFTSISVWCSIAVFDNCSPQKLFINHSIECWWKQVHWVRIQLLWRAALRCTRVDWCILGGAQFFLSSPKKWSIPLAWSAVTRVKDVNWVHCDILWFSHMQCLGRLECRVGGGGNSEFLSPSQKICVYIRRLIIVPGSLSPSEILRVWL